MTYWNLVYNHTSTDVTKRDLTLLNNSRVNLIEEGQPDTRWNFTVNHNYENLRLLVRLNYYGEYFDNEAGGEFDQALIIDLEGGMAITENIDVAVGARNMTDEKGCSTNDCGGTPANVLGLSYSQFTLFGFNGAFYYGKPTYNFE